MSSTTSRRLAVQRLLAGFLCGLIGLLAFARWGFWAEMVGCAGGFLLGTALPRVSWRWSPRRELQQMRTHMTISAEAAFTCVNVTIAFGWMLLVLMSELWVWNHAPGLIWTARLFGWLNVLLGMYIFMVTVPECSVEKSLEMSRHDSDGHALHVVRWRRFQRFGPAAFAVDQYNRVTWAVVGAHLLAVAYPIGFLYRILYMWRSLPMFTTIAYLKVVRVVRRWTESFAVSAIAAVVTTVASGYLLRPHFATLTVGVCALCVGVMAGVVSYIAPIIVGSLLRADDDDERSVIAECRRIVVADWALAKDSLVRHTPCVLARIWHQWFPNMQHWHLSL